jgi:hypothetical protein
MKTFPRERLRTGEPLTDAELQELGNALRPCARGLSAEFQRILAKEYEDITFVFSDLAHMPEEGVDTDTLAELRFVRMSVRIPPLMLAFAAAILASLPDSGRRGRPPKTSTVQARKLLEKNISKRLAAKLAATDTGESPDLVRSRLSRRSTKKPRAPRS